MSVVGRGRPEVARFSRRDEGQPRRDCACSGFSIFSRALQSRDDDGQPPRVYLLSQHFERVSFGEPQLCILEASMRMDALGESCAVEEVDVFNPRLFLGGGVWWRESTGIQRPPWLPLGLAGTVQDWGAEC